MNEKLNGLLLQASDLFLTHGIKSLTMNDIAGKLGISKKTLYNYVSDKNDLVVKCIELHINTNECEMNAACQGSSNAVEELIKFSQIAGAKMKLVHPSIFYDLQKYHQDAWNVIRDFEDNSILELTKANLQKGIEQGLYRKEMNINIIADVYISIVRNIFHNVNGTHQGVSNADYYFEIFNYHIRGIANQEGIKLINQYLN